MFCIRLKMHTPIISHVRMFLRNCHVFLDQFCLVNLKFASSPPPLSSHYFRLGTKSYRTIDKLTKFCQFSESQFYEIQNDDLWAVIDLLAATSARYLKTFAWYI